MQAKGLRQKKTPLTSVGRKTGSRKHGIDARAARSAVHEYCLLHFGTSYVGGIPRRLALAKEDLWIVPVVFTSPGYGVVGEVGMVAVDATSGGVVGATPRPEVRTAGTRLAQEKRHEIDAAFHRARTV